MASKNSSRRSRKAVAASFIGVGTNYAQCLYCGRWLSPHPHFAPNSKRLAPRGKSDITAWTIEQLEEAVANALPRNPLLEHFIHLMFEHDFGPPLLWHYTSHKAARNIIRTTSIWASDAYELNDCQEVEYPCRLLREEIKGRQTHFLKRGQRLFADLCQALFEKLATPRDCYPAVFVFCLTEHAASERHWKRYSSDEGFALGFGFPWPWTLGLFVSPEEGDAVLRRVVYDRNMQRQMLADVVDTYLELVGETMCRAGASAAELLLPDLATVFVEDFKEFASRVVVSIKAPRWQQEREWRVIVSPRPRFVEGGLLPGKMDSIRRRSRAGKTLKYVELMTKSDLLPVCSMIAGRDCTIKARKGISGLLRKTGYQVQLMDRLGP